VEKSVDCFLFIGTGRFHPLGLSLETEKPVLFLDFESGKFEDLTQDRDNLRRVRNAGIAKSASAERFGILVSTKPGQAHSKTAEQARKRLEKLGKKAWILVADRLTPEKLLGLGVQALVNTACPRIREDARSFRKPVISPEDIRYLEESEKA
jgi:2-(3-amino-3-carboxypropyl)histidine synthase